MNTLFLIILANFLISLLSLLGLFTLSLKEKLFEKILFTLIALSAGALMGGAFLHLIPEAIEEFNDPQIFLYVLVGFVLFFLMEKLLHWRHCHEGKCPEHTFAYMNLLGDVVHNFIDGLTIAASFIVNPSLGFVTALAVALHEIPQEIGDFGVLIYGGFSKKKALILNFSIALTAILGGIFGFFLSNTINLNRFLLPFAAGGFIYIASSDLIPEIKKETDRKKSFLSFTIFILGILLMYLLRFIS
ncbi:ZIP family metal transporter [Candidatus Microgenomates bacterium]|nr:ZIP family metal transporter [Candidatus Microgenomates bacterium]